MLFLEQFSKQNYCLIYKIQYRY